jgi:hypothetical protein
VSTKFSNLFAKDGENTSNIKMDASFEAFTAVKIQVEVFWVVTPCSVVVGYH